MRTGYMTKGLLLLSLFLSSAVGLNLQGRAGREPGGQPPARRAGAAKRLGVFTNMRFTREHQYGYSVELWREGDRVFGLLLVSEGLAGDTPTGLLEDAALDPKTGRLTFRARLSTGSTFNKNNEQVPTRDVYRFKGTLRGQTLTGILEHTDDSGGSAAVRRTRVSLRRSKGDSGSVVEAGSYDEWKREADEILKLRGPKW